MWFLSGKQFSVSYPGNMRVTMGNFPVLISDWLKNDCYPRITPLFFLVTRVTLGWKESNIQVVASDWFMMWDLSVITRKLRVVFPLGNFGATEGSQIVYRVENGMEEKSWQKFQGVLLTKTYRSSDVKFCALRVPKLHDSQLQKCLNHVFPTWNNFWRKITEKFGKKSRYSFQ